MKRRLPPRSSLAPRLRHAWPIAGLFVCAVLASPLLAQTAAQKDPPASGDGAPRVDLDKLKRPTAPATPSNLFGARSWENKAPPKKAAPPPPPPPPQAPPLPFTYMGRWIERGETTVMIARGNQNFTVRQGEKIDPTYLLEKVDADKLVIRYLPLDEAQVLSLGAPPAAALAPQQPRPNVQLLPNQKRGAARDADDEED